MKTKVLFVSVTLFWLMPVLFLSAQDYSLIDRDSLRLLISDKKIPDSARLNNIYILALSYDYVSPDSMIFYARILRSEADKMHDLKGIIRSDWMEGYNLQYQGKWKEALKYHLHALQLAGELGNKKMLLNSYTNVGNDYMNVGILDTALVYHNDALGLARALRDKNSEAMVLMNMAIVYDLAENTAKSIEINKRLLSLIDSLPSPFPNMKAAALHNLAHGLVASGKPEEALKYLLQAYDLNKINNNRNYLKYNLQLLGNIYEADSGNYLAKKSGEGRDRYDIALGYFKELEKIAREDRDTSTLAGMYLSMGRLYLDKGELSQSLKVLKQGWKWNRFNQDPDVRVGYADALANVYYKLGDYRNASAFYRSRITYSDSLDKVKIADKVGRLSENYELQAKDLQLKEKNRQLKDKVLISRLFIALTIMIFVFALIISFSYIMKQRAARILKAKNVEVEEARVRAERGEKFKEQFLANMSHEIRTPLNTVIGITDLMLDEFQTARNESYLKKIKQAGDHLLTIINDILDLSKLEAGKLDLTESPFNLPDLIKGTREMFELKAKEKDIELNASLDPDIHCWLAGDHHRIRQVLVNLVGNAIKFTDSGSVSILVYKIEVSDNECILQFRVEDTGRGIPADQQELIFEEFIQLQDNKINAFHGTGLGLSISRKLVKLMGGNLLIESYPGNGSAFYFSIPVKISSESAFRECRKDYAPSTGARKGAFRILIVEDNASSQVVTEGHLERILPESSFLVATDGFNALEVMEREKIDLVLMDVQMPGMDGYETTRKIREMKSDSARVPVVALTASAVKTDVERCFSSGMNSYVAKPIQRSILAKEIFNQLGIENEEAIEIIPAKRERFLDELPDKPSWVPVLFQTCNDRQSRFIRYLDLFLYEMNYELSDWEYYLRQKKNKKIAASVHKLMPQIRLFTCESVHLNASRIEEKFRSGWDPEYIEPVKELRNVLYQTREEIQRVLKFLDV